MQKMKRSLSLIVISLLLTGCSLSTPSTSSSSSSSSSTDSATGSDRFVGTWVMTSEESDVDGDTFINPATNKLLEINEDGTVEEDFSSLEGLGVCDTTQGRYTGEWMYEGDTFTIDIASAVEEIEPYIDCGPGAGTNAVPRSVVAFSYNGESWEFSLSADGQTLTAVMSGNTGGPAIIITQTFEKQ